MAKTIPNINVTIRRDKETNRPVLFFVNSNSRGYWIECYDRIGQHSESSRGYMQSCALEDGTAKDAQALMREWSSLDDSGVAVAGKRLFYPRGLNYIGG